MIKLLKAFTILEIAFCIVCAVINFILGDIIGGIILIMNAFFIAIFFVPIIQAWNRSKSNEEKIAKLKDDQVKLINRVKNLENKFELLKNELSRNHETTPQTDTQDGAGIADIDNLLKPKECPFCGSIVSDCDDQCWFCGFDLKNGSC